MKTLMAVIVGVAAMSAAPAREQDKAPDKPQEKPPAPDKVVLSIADLLDKVGPKIERRFIYGEDANLAGLKVIVPVIDDKTPRADVEMIVYSVLRLKSLVMIRSADGTPFTIIAPVSQAYKLGVPILGPDTPIPPGDEAYIRIFITKPLPAAEAVPALANLVTFPQAVIPLNSVGMLIVTDYASNLRKIEKILVTVGKT